MKIKNLIIIFLTFNCFVVYAKSLEEIGVGLGMTSLSYSEQQGNVSGENISDPSSGSLSVITTNLYWKSIPKNQFSYFFEGYFPLIPGSGSAFFGGGFGTEYYFSDDNVIVREQNDGFKISMDPKLRYYALASITLNYFAYETESAKKNDIAAALNLGGGAVYSINSDYAVKGDIALGRGVGVITSVFMIRAFASLVYYWDN